MNTRISSLVLILAVALGFLLRGCLPSQTAIVAPKTVTIIDAYTADALIICRDSVTALLLEIEMLKSRGVKVVSKEVIKHDTIESSPQIVTVPYPVKSTDTIYLNKGLKSAAVFENENMYCRVFVGDSLATLDSLAIFNTIKATVNEVPIDKYSVQRSVMFQSSNLYISKHDGVYVEMPRYTDKGISHLKNKAMFKGVIWGVIGGAVLTTTYFLIHK